MPNELLQRTANEKSGPELHANRTRAPEEECVNGRMEESGVPMRWAALFVRGSVLLREGAAVHVSCETALALVAILDHALE